MKRLLIVIFLLNTLNVFAQPQLTENQKLESLAKVWGFLKYYHPTVAKGKLDWDAELMQKIVEVKATKDQQDLNKLYCNWIDKLGKVTPCKSCDNNVPDSLKRNLDLSWVYDTTVLTSELSERLDYILKNRNQGKNHYVRYPYKLFKTQAEFTEGKYEHLEELPSEEYRLLGLFRHWNIINYFFPYKYATDAPWNSVLTYMLPKFRNAATPLDYHLAMLELSNSIDDGHNTFRTNYTGKYFGGFYPAFKYQLLNNKVLVTGYYHKEFAQADSVFAGDVIAKLNGIPVKDVLALKLPYIPGSNYNYKVNWINSLFLNGDTPSLTVTIEKDGKEFERQIRRYAFSRFGYTPDTTAQPSWKMLTSEIGLINIKSLKTKEVNNAMKELRNSKAIIIDMREYPGYTIGALAKHLLPNKITTAVMPYPDLKYPGVFRPKQIKYGKKGNKDYYKGKVVLLVDAGTMSKGEFGTMAFQLAPNATVIGRQTAGADGNITYINFPGGFRASMSGLGVYYPDGRETQRIGIVPDIEVKPTIEGILKNKDEILERAILFVESGK